MASGEDSASAIVPAAILVAAVVVVVVLVVVVVFVVVAVADDLAPSVSSQSPAHPNNHRLYLPLVVVALP